MSQRDWREYAEDMIEYLGDAIRFTDGVPLADFEANKEKYLAVSRAMEIAGAAAKQVPPEVRARYPTVDWRGLAAFRDVLAHAYLFLKREIIWDAAVNKAPIVRDELLRILRGDEQE
ncbi:MAG TPA: HepT-like ribonuclease domain-containing protein [Longimicrobium sp.]|jgi:uncharacterized protein with HEPN domain|nr:HepT-like ribonuclease domain-containing protein [Longimicrobium sp.]